MRCGELLFWTTQIKKDELVMSHVNMTFLYIVSCGPTLLEYTINYIRMNTMCVVEAHVPDQNLINNVQGTVISIMFGLNFNQTKTQF